MTSSDDDLEIAAQSFVDGELLASERLEFLELMKNDGALRLRVSELLYQKELVRQAFSDIPEPESHDAGHVGRSRISRNAVAALMVLALVGVSLTGGVYVGRALQSIPHAAESSGHGAVADAANSPDYRLITENGVEMAHSLAQVADLLKAARTRQRGPVALVVNEKALRSSKATNSLYAKRIGLLLQEHPNLHLVACGADVRQTQTHSLKAFSPAKTQRGKAFSLLSNC